MGRKDTGLMNKYVYDAFLWTFSILVELFFREVHPRSSWKIPREGPVLFVCAPHANQFVDPLILMRCVKKESDRRIHFLIAEKSMKRKFVGAMAGLTGAVSVGRAMDSTKPAVGKIYLPDPSNDPCLVRGVGTNFEDKVFQVGGTLYLPKVNEASASAEISEIVGPEEIRLKRAFKGDVAKQQLTGKLTNGAQNNTEDSAEFQGTNFQVAPKLNQKEVYDKVHAVLHAGGSIGIFPEGGSHDRTDLLPLKAGVAIMALGTVAEKRDCNLKIIPVGMNYFHAHKFRSRAVIEFGTPLEVPLELVDKYVGDGRREAIGTMLDLVREALITVTVTAPDYDTLMLIQAVRRLYNPKGTKLPLPRIIELNRRLVKGYERYKDDQRIIDLKVAVLKYNNRLFALGIRDHQVQYSKLPMVQIFFLFWFRLAKLLVFSVFVIPGTLLFSLVFIFTKLISIKKAKEALAASNVKIQARDVMATWKLLVALVVAPVSYGWHVTWVTYCYRHGYFSSYIRPGIPTFWFILAQVILYPAVTYAALRFGEVAMDIVKSLWPLIKLLNPTSNNEMIKLQSQREQLAQRVNDIINTLGPEMFEDFHSKRVISEPFAQSPPQTPDGSRRKSDAFAVSPENERPSLSHLPRNESYGDLSNQDIFSTRPPTPKKSRSRNASLLGGFQLKGFSTLDGQESLDEVSRKIRGAMRERGTRRSSTTDGFEGGSGATTPGSTDSELPEGLTMTKKHR